jgi:hypothetical protein
MEQSNFKIQKALGAIIFLNYLETVPVQKNNDMEQVYSKRFEFQLW